MGLFESVFDVSYLILVIFLGVRLLLESKPGAKLFGVMAIFLGVGDAFHLIPRVISHLSPGGFAAYGFALSWGQFVTSITMTLFYVLFYHFYSNQSGEKSKKKLLLVYGLAAIRIISVLMPQNEWGTMPGNYMFGIYRNIPFSALGLLLICWTYQHRDKPALKLMSFLIFLSFAFYFPVVLFSDSYPAVGVLMIPKTLAYFFIVVLGYRHFVGAFRSIHLLGLAFTSMIMGLISGVFYREFTKFYEYEALTHLSKLHVHILTLGFFAMLVFYLLAKKYDYKEVNLLRMPLKIYLSGLTFTIVNMLLFGIYEVVAQGEKTISVKALEGLSGLGHIALSVGLSWLLITIFGLEKIRYEKKNEQVRG